MRQLNNMKNKDIAKHFVQSFSGHYDFTISKSFRIDREFFEQSNLENLKKEIRRCLETMKENLIDECNRRIEYFSENVNVKM